MKDLLRRGRRWGAFLTAGLLMWGWPATVDAQNYCTSNLYTTGCAVNDYIAGVQLANLNRTSACDNSSTSYIFWTSDTIVLTKGQAYTLTVTNNPNWSEYFAAWLDDESDGFDDADFIDSSGQIAGGGTWSTTFTAPLGTGATTYDTGRLRIRQNYSGVISRSDTCTTFIWGETEDYVVILMPPSGPDVVAWEVLNAGDGCGPATRSLPFVIHNGGTTISAGQSVNWQIDTNGVMACSGTYTFATDFPTGTKDTISGCNVNFPVTGTAYTVTAYVTYTGDVDNTNDTVVHNFTNSAAGMSAPWTDGFENNGVFEPNTVGEDTLAVGWTVNPGGGVFQYRWQTETDQTGSFNTGPAAPYSGIRYVYTEASWGGVEATLTGPCVDISAVTMPYLVYAYHMYGAQMGDLHVEVQDGSGTWTTVKVWNGQQQTAMTEPWKVDFVDLSSFTSPVRVRFRGIRGTGFQGDMAVDSVQIKDLQPDVGVIEVLEPNDGCGLGSAVPTQFVVQNFGPPMTGVTVPYEVMVNGTVACNGSMTLTLNPGDTAIISGCAVNLSTVGTHTVKIYTQYAADVDNTNDTATKAVEHLAPTTAPWADGFENNGLFEPNTVGEDTLAIGWKVNPGGGLFEYRWRTEDGHVGTTGPAAPYSGSRYTFVESGFFTGEEAVLISRCVDASALTSPYLIYAYHMYGAGMGDLHVEIQEAGGGTWTTLRTWSGQQHTSATDPWGLDYLDVSGYTSPFRVRFRATRIQGAPNWFSGDMAVDSVEVRNLQPDIGVTVIDTPVEGCALGASVPTVFVVQNFGQPLTGVTVPYEVMVNGTVACSGNITLTLNPGETDTITGCAVNLSTAGTYTVKVYTQYAADVDNTNDTATKTVEHFASMTAPWGDGFENNGVFEPNVTGEDTLAIGWKVSPGGGVFQYRWQTETDQTGSFGTGPAAPYSGIRYVYTEASWLGTEATLTGPCVDATALTTPYLVYAYHMYGSGMGDLHVEIQEPGGGPWTTLRTWSGQQHTSETDPWSVDYVDISGYTSPFRVRFRGVRGTSFTSDMAVDSVLIKDLQPDVGVVAIDTPVSGCGLGTAIPTVFVVQNFGQPLTGVTMPYEVMVNGTVACSGNITLTLNPGETDTITGCAVNLSTVGSHTVKIYTQYAADVDNTNDTATKVVEHFSPMAAPWFDGFEANAAGEPNAVGEDTLAGGWTLTPGGGAFQYRWITEDGPTPSFNTGPSGPYSGARYVYTEASASSPSEALLVGPCLDVASLTTPYLIYAYHMFGGGMGDLHVEVQEAGGGAWTTLRTWSGPQHAASSDPWSVDYLDLSGYTSPLRIRFRGVRGTNFQGDMSVDSVQVKDLQPDVGVSDISAPTSACGLGTETFVFDITNYGQPLPAGTVIPYSVDTNGVNACSGSYTLASALNPGQTVTVTGCAVDLSNVTTYAVDVYTTYGPDVDNSNDTTSEAIQNIPVIAVSGTATYSESFESGPAGWTAEDANLNGSTWEWGDPSSYTYFGNTINTAAHGTNAWEMNIGGTYQTNEEDYLYSPCFDFSGATNPIKVEFSYWMHTSTSWQGVDFDTLTRRANMWGKVGANGDPYNWYNSTVGVLGDGWSGFGSGWVRATRYIDLQGVDTVQFRFQFQGAFFVSGDGFAVDSFQVEETQPDVGVTSIDSPVSACVLSSNEATKFWVTNFGAPLAAGTVIPYEVMLNGTVACSGNITLAAALNPGDSVAVTGCAVNLSAVGTYDLKIYTQYGPDVDNTNDTAASTVENYPVTSLPWADGFEANAPGEPNALGEDTLAVGWKVNPGGGAFRYRWITEDLTTPSFGTGPSGPYAGSRYVYVEASATTPSEATLTSRCVDISSATSPYLIYAYHMYGASMGDLHVEIKDSGATAWTTLRTWSGQQHTSSTDPWSLDYLDISGYTSPVQIRFRGVRGFSFQGDMAVDSVLIKDLQPDVGVSAINAPASACGLGLETFEFDITNYGAPLPAGTVIPYSVDTNGVNACSGTYTLATAFNPGDVLTITGCAVDLSTPGAYAVDVYTSYGPDTDNSNDTTSQTISHIPTYTISSTSDYVQSFESGPDFWTVESNNGITTWELGTPAGATINSAAHGTQAWVTNLTGPYVNNEQGYVVSPCFDIDPAVAQVEFSFSIWWDSEFSWDGAALDTMRNGGTWGRVGQQGDPFNWYNDNTITGLSWTGNQHGWSGRFSSGSGGWVRAKRVFSTLSGANGVQFRVHFGSDGSITDDGFAFDSVVIREILPDVGVSSVDSPTAGCGLGAAEPVWVTVTNYGADLFAGTVIPYTVIVNGGTPCTGTHTLAADLINGATVSFNTGCTGDFSAVGDHTVQAYTTYGPDADNTNDTTTATVGHYTPAALGPMDIFVDNFNCLDDITTQVSGTTLTSGNPAATWTYTKNVNGRLQTAFVNYAPSAGPTRAITLDASPAGSFSENFMTLELDMSAYDTSSDLIWLSLFARDHGDETHFQDAISVRGDNASPWVSLQNSWAPTSTWQEFTYDVTSALKAAGQNFSATFQVRIAQYDNFPVPVDGISFDSVRIYELQPDVGVVDIVAPQDAACNYATNEPVTFVIQNFGTPLSNATVYYSVSDNGVPGCSGSIPNVTLATGDTMHYTVTCVDLSADGDHPIYASAWVMGDVDPSNQTFIRTVRNKRTVTTFPYRESFESYLADDDWHSGAVTGTANSWERGTPSTANIDGAGSGLMAMVTNAAGNYANSENSYVEGPCYDLSGFTAEPVVSMLKAHMIEDFFDDAWVEYSEDDGATWTKLGTSTTGTNWYNDPSNVWDNVTADEYQWQLASHTIPTASMTNTSNVRIRIRFQSDGTVTHEGFAFDEFTVADSATRVWDPASTPTTHTANVTPPSTGMTTVMVSGDYGFAIDPLGNNLGNTQVGICIKSGPWYAAAPQAYVLERNFYVIPSTPPTSPVMVYLYFTDAEYQALRALSGGNTGPLAQGVNRLGVTRYHGANEDCDWFNNTDSLTGRNYYRRSGMPTNKYAIRPYNNGYELRVKVEDLSEFWINTPGNITGGPLPVEFAWFTAERVGDDALLRWATASEQNSAYFRVEVATEMVDGVPVFRTLGTVEAAGESSELREYKFVDREPNKVGVRYYRVVEVDRDGTEMSSDIRKVDFGGMVVTDVRVSPNPFTDAFHIYLGAEGSERVTITLEDVRGAVIHTVEATLADGVNDVVIAPEESLAAGTYLLRIRRGDRTDVIPVVKRK